MITIRPVQGAYTHGFHVEGHADFAKHGQDIVCAAVSALTQTCLNSLKRYSTIEASAESGHMHVKVANPNAYTQVLISSMVSGLAHIEQAYHNHLIVEKENLHDREENTRV